MHFSKNRSLPFSWTQKDIFINPKTTGIFCISQTLMAIIYIRASKKNIYRPKQSVQGLPQWVRVRFIENGLWPWLAQPGKRYAEEQILFHSLLIVLLYSYNCPTYVLANRSWGGALIAFDDKSLKINRGMCKFIIVINKFVMQRRL